MTRDQHYFIKWGGLTLLVVMLLNLGLYVIYRATEVPAEKMPECTAPRLAMSYHEAICTFDLGQGKYRWVSQ